MRVAVVSMTGDWPLTVTVSCSVATFSATLTCALKPSVMRMPSRTSRLEAGELEREPVFARRHGGEAVDARFVGHGGQRADLRRARGGDGDAGQHAALRVLHFTADAAGRARAAALRERRRCQQPQRPRAPRQCCSNLSCGNLQRACRAKEVPGWAGTNACAGR